MTTTHERVITSQPVDWLARVVTSAGPEYSPAARGWEPGAFSRVSIPYDVRHRLTGRVCGRLVVLGCLPDGRGSKGWRIVARCSCSNHVILRARHVRHQSIRMCAECDDVRRLANGRRPARVKKSDL